MREGKQDEETLLAAEEQITKFLTTMIDPDPDAQHVYFIAAGDDAVKIGYALDPEGWLNRMRSYNHKPLELLGVIPFGAEAIEQALHVKFWHLHIEDLGIRGEWFYMDQELLAWIRKHATPDVPYWLERQARINRL